MTERVISQRAALQRVFHALLRERDEALALLRECRSFVEGDYSAWPHPEDVYDARRTLLARLGSLTRRLRIVAEGDILTVYRALKQAERERDALRVASQGLREERDQWRARCLKADAERVRLFAERDTARDLLRECRDVVVVANATPEMSDAFDDLLARLDAALGKGDQG